MVRVAGYLIDCALEERLNYEAEVSTNPIEKGSDFTDHVQRKRPVLEFEGLVSDTPRGKVKLETSRSDLAGQRPSADAFRRFTEIYEAGLPVAVECSYGRFENMLLETLSPTRDVKSAKAFRFTATFRQIKIVENKRVTVLVSRGDGKTDRGAQVAKRSGDDTVWVLSVSSASAPAWEDLYGPPVLITTFAQRNRVNAASDAQTLAQGDSTPRFGRALEYRGVLHHFRLRPGASNNPDGWVEKNQYYRLGGSHDPGNKRWKGWTDEDVTRQTYRASSNPDENARRWHQVSSEFGKPLGGS